MRKFGWFYLASYLIDCLLSVVSVIVQSLEPLSSWFSAPMMLAAPVVFLLSALGALPPRRVFLTLSGFYLALSGFGIVMAVLLAMKVGLNGMSGGMAIPLMSEHFPWFTTANWILLVTWLVLALFGLAEFRNSQAHAEAQASPSPTAWPVEFGHGK